MRVEHELDFHDGGRRVRGGSFSLTDIDGERRDYTFRDLGWVYCQGGGYFGGFDDGLGQGVYRGDAHEEGEVWDVSHPTTVVTADGREIARGLINYAANDARRIARHGSAEIESTLGYVEETELIHRDNLVLIS